MTRSQENGKIGESLALAYFLKKDYFLLQKNYRSRWGEIDLIIQAPTLPKTLVFVEVKYRRNNKYGTAEESVTLAKQRKIIRTAQDYLLKNEHFGPCQFDVLAILAPSTVTHIENAFEFQ